MSHPDGAQHVLGWLFFRNEPWHFPLGSLSSFCHPVGTAVAFTDSIPWLAVIAKIFSPLMPSDFQYIGPWLGLCFVLQGYLGAKIVQVWSPAPIIQVLGAAFFIFDPVLIRRVGHDSLSAHWLILGLIWLHLRPCPDSRTGHRILGAAFGACILSAGVHPYLAAMVLALSFALLWKLCWVDHRLSMYHLVGWGVALIVSVAIVFAVFGYIGSKVLLGSSGFGVYSADLLTLINPMGGSHFLPTFPTAPGQYEGYGYLGAGVLVLCITAAVSIGHRRRSFGDQGKKHWIPLGICCMVLAVYSLSSKLTIAGTPVLVVEVLYRPAMNIVDIFRVSGRFIWPLHYLIITGAVHLWVQQFQFSRLISSIVLAAVVIIQLLDANPSAIAVRKHTNRFRQEMSKHLHKLDLEPASGLYQHMVLYPPLLWGGGFYGCVDLDFRDNYSHVELYYLRYIVPLAYHAYKSNLTFNSGYVARIDKERAQKYCETLERQISEGDIKGNTIYIVHRAYWNIFDRNIAKIVCGQLNDYSVCVSAQRHDAFRELLESYRIE
jgi:Family of unknown function (DUF6311)